MVRHATMGAIRQNPVKHAGLDLLKSSMPEVMRAGHPSSWPSLRAVIWPIGNGRIGPGHVQTPLNGLTCVKHHKKNSVTTVCRQTLISLALTAMIVVLEGCGGGSAGDGDDSAQPGIADSATPNNTLPGTVIIVGDSIMAGCADSINQPRPDYTMTTAHLVATQGVRVVNLSRPGNSIATADTQRVDGGINFTQGGQRGTAIWIALGVNDFFGELSNLQQYRDRYLRLLSRIEPVARQKLFCVTPLMSGFDYDHRATTEGSVLEDYRQVVRDIAAAGHCALVDTTHWFEASDIYDDCNMPDTLHLGQDGHLRYTKNLLEQISGDYSDAEQK